MGAGRRTVRLRGRPPSSAGSPPSGPTSTSARTRTTSPASRRPTTSRRWDGSAWSALGAAAAARTGGSRRRPRSTPWPATGSHLFVTGTFQNADGDARADNVAFFDGTAWHPVGSDGAGNGPWSGTGLALALVDRQLYAAGSFTSAGGDPQAHSVASFSLTQIIAYPTPTVTPGPSAVPDAHGDAQPARRPPRRHHGAQDVAPRSARVNQAEAARRRSRSPPASRGSTFPASSTRRKFKPCTSPKTYKKLKPGKHVFRVKARDRAGNVDATPAVKRFKIARRR